VDRDVLSVSPNLAYAACASNVPEAIVTAESSVVSTPHRNVPDISTVPDVIELDTWISLVRMVAEFSIIIRCDPRVYIDSFWYSHLIHLSLL
jgi:hypothetical protein